MKLFSYFIRITRHKRGMTRAGLGVVRLRGVGGFLVCLNAPIIGDCCLDVRRA